MDQIVPGLYASPPEPLSFAPDLHIRAFLTKQVGGNHLIYSNGQVPGVANDIEAHGGFDSQILTHWHEAEMGAAAIAQRFGAPVYCHAADRQEVEKRVAVNSSFDRRQAYFGDMEVVPIPGHTPGASAVLWRGPEHRCLFTGDSLFISKGVWRVAVLESSDPVSYLGSLETIAALDFDLLVPWVASAGAAAATPVTRDTVRREVEAIIERVRAGART